MKIMFSPQRLNEILVASRVGDVLTLNGEAFDFGPLGEGDSLPSSAMQSKWFAGPVTRTSGNLVVTLLLPLPINFSPAQAFPEPLMLTRDGPVKLPQPLQESAA